MALSNNNMNNIFGKEKESGTGYAGGEGGTSGGEGGFYIDDYNSGNDYSSGWWTGYPYGGGYGGGGKSAAEVQAETQAQIKNTAGNYGKRGSDMSDLGQESLNNIRDQINQNLALYNQTRRNNMKQIEWQPQEQKKQSSLSSLRGRMGNTAYGSGLTDLDEGFSRVDDMSDVQLINAYKQNENAARDNWFQANEDLISDYIDQMVAIKDEFSKLYSQYWATQSNANPQLASEENIGRSARGETSSFGEGTDYYELPGAAGVTPTEALRALFVAPQRASAVNPYTFDYLRPATTEAPGRTGNTGSVARSTAANPVFFDNLSAYRRQV